MPETGRDEWLGREDLAWNILLAARVEDPPPGSELRQRLALLLRRQAWPAPGDASVVEGGADEVLAKLSELRDPELPVSVGRTADGVVVRGHHAHVDGLGLLGVLRDLVAEDLSSGASGVGDRPRRSTASTVASRLVEAVARPPAGLAATVPADGVIVPPGDTFVARSIPGEIRTAAVAHATVQAIAARNRANGRRRGRVALAVGVSTVGGRELRLADDSGFLRVTNAERLDRDAMARVLGRASLQVGGTARTASAHRAGPLIRWGSEVLASRLGSTVLVSHLGRVEASGLTGLAFYPLAGNGTGLSVGAATVQGRTTITLRARGSQHGATDLEDLLDAISTRLP